MPRSARPALRRRRASRPGGGADRRRRAVAPLGGAVDRLAPERTRDDLATGTRLHTAVIAEIAPRTGLSAGAQRRGHWTMRKLSCGPTGRWCRSTPPPPTTPSACSASTTRPQGRAGADLRRGAEVHRRPAARRRELPGAAGPVPFDLDRPWWVRDGSFDLEYHIREIALAPAGDWRQLCTQVARIHARPLDLSRPPWELYIITGLDGVEHVPEGSFVGFLRVHHAAIDGVAGAEILTAIHTHEPDGEPPPPAPGYRWEPDPDPERRRPCAGPSSTASSVRSESCASPPRAPRRSRCCAADSQNADVTSPASLLKATRFNHRVSPTGSSGRRTRPSTPSSRSARRCRRRRSTTSAWRSSAGRSAPISSTRASSPRSRCWR